MKNFIGFARVSSREQEREGFSLGIQVDAINSYAKQNGGVISKMFKVAETASTSKERAVFKEMIRYMQENASNLDAILVYKFDRAARNMKDYNILEEIESTFKINLISVTQPSEVTPSGKLLRRFLANVAAYQTEQMSIDITEGIKKRVETGWFSSKAPYGYQNTRIEGKSIVQVHHENGFKIKRIFELRVEGLTVEEIVKTLYKEGTYYSKSQPRFTPSKVNAMLHDQSYIGMVKYHGQWYKGSHFPIIDKATWDAVRVSFCEQKYRSHDMAYANELIICGCCNHPITGESKRKQTKSGTITYVYYRCARYQQKQHPRIRLREQELDQQFRQFLSEVKCERPEVQQLLVCIAKDSLEEELAQNWTRTSSIKQQISRKEPQLDTLLDALLSQSIDGQVYDSKKAKLLDELESLRASLITQQEEREHADLVAQQSSRLFALINECWTSYKPRQKNDILNILFRKFRLIHDRIEPGSSTRVELFQNL